MIFPCPLALCLIIFLSRLVVSFPANRSDRNRASLARPSDASDVTTNAIRSSMLLQKLSLSDRKPPIYIHQSQESMRLMTRDQATTVDAKTFIAGKIVFNFACKLPKYEDAALSESRKTICNLVETGLTRAAVRIQQILNLQTPITVSATFESNCLQESVDAQSLSDCKWNKVLGAAAPSGWHDLHSEGLLHDEFLYPTALARQYFPNNTSIQGVSDINVNLNSDSPWWFPTENNPHGEGSGNGGSYGPPLIRTRTFEFGIGLVDPTEPHVRDENLLPSDKVYDFEQTAIHEIMHGLGFVSAWGPHLDDVLLPSSPVLLSNETGSGKIVSLGKSYIFDRTLEHTGTRTLMSEYAAAMRAEAENISKLVNEQSSEILDDVHLLSAWRESFLKSPAGKLGQTLQNGVASTPMQLLFWYKRGYSIHLEEQFSYAILYTPRVYDGGSSLSHIDASVYGSTKDYLMRPFCTTGSGIDALTPHQRGIGVLGTVVVGMLRQMGYTTH
ncbi:hypothetical protein HDU80_006266 [Chytriomyces hyalinus]|nr:hypothetical protein HDU80_006266 [Chytriomyces hyalinus]